MIENGAQVSPCYIYIIKITLLGRTLNYFESKLFYRDGPFTKNVSFVGARKKCYIFENGEQTL